MSVDIITPTNWADDIGEELGTSRFWKSTCFCYFLLQPSLRLVLIQDTDRYAPKVYTDENGLKVFVEFKRNEEGKMVKITRKIKMILKKEHVNRAVAERKKWAKFGDEKGSPPGPNLQTTSVGEQIFLKLSANQAFQEDADDGDKQKNLLKGKKILCRICKGDHFTTKCPYKDTIQPIEDIAPTSELKEAPSTGGKYMAPHQRRAAASGEGTGESMPDKRDDSASLRVTNLSEDTRESDIYDLFRKFGHIARVFLAKDYDTGLCKGFAFVSFSLREEADRARQALDGHGYANLILRVEWSQPTNK